MSTTPDSPRPAYGAPAGQSPPEPVKAVPVRHPGRWVAAGVLLLLAAMFVHMLITNDAFDWPFLFEQMFSAPVLIGVRTTIILAAVSLAIGIAIGIVVAIMRLSDNPVLVAVAWVYTWFFRAVPRIVLCVLFGNIAILYQTIEFGVPFDNYWLPLLGFEDGARFYSVPMETLLSPFVAAVIALSLSQGAYMGEIVRAGLLSVEKGQTEAAQALGMSHGLVLRRITLPQALRVIIPPTGNEATAIMKDTSLVSAIPLTTELFFQLQQIGARTFNLFPMLVAACLWYLAITSVMMVIQYYLEQTFNRADRGTRTVGVRGAA
ncbi:amino acid ABC transporter permease [Streptomonospora litoralis]|uniref:Inner membrane amino-acid ABC transporter permease protein YecS n=1 Tax=Streptomonospora litoralis TaxID=2498135 RepID=A0A4P6PWS3_9ACTN|nr:amino acid ABC transporter permease [Streptomonospora litoralis]QBI52686.1 Inner membrane amino-acid ABC transporter permease protein YecS [Streptomonospora litoralis]